MPCHWGKKVGSGIKAPAINTPGEPGAAPASDTFKFRWDVLLFLVFLVSAAPHATGFELHEWVGLAVIPLLLVHLLLNWSWIVGVSSRVFTRLAGEVRFNLVFDSLLFIGMALVMVSGVLASRTALRALGFAVGPDPFWEYVHGIISNVVIVMIGVHVAMHGRWIIARLRRVPRTISPGKEL